jgi:hypothetical protein
MERKKGWEGGGDQQKGGCREGKKEGRKIVL